MTATLTVVSSQPVTVNAALADRLDDAIDLKHELVEFAQGKRFERWLGKLMLRAALNNGPLEKEEAWIREMDDFVLTFRFPGGDTVVDRFIKARKDLDDIDRSLLARWKRSAESLFEVRAKNAGDEIGSITLLNLLDDLTYEVYYRATGAQAVRTLAPGDFMQVKLIPFGDDEWMISGLVGGVPQSQMRNVAKMAVALAADAPSRAFSNPELLKRSWEAMRADRNEFIDYFGSDEVVFETAEVAGRINAYRLHAMKKVKTQASQGLDVSGRVPTDYFARFELPSNVQWADTIGVIYDEADGMEYLVDYEKVRAVFADPSLAGSEEHAELLRGYLEDDNVSPLPFRRLAAAYPDTADEVFRTMLSRPDFTWEKDGEKLLRQHKAAFYAEKQRPSLAVFGSRLLDLANPLGLKRKI